MIRIHFKKLANRLGKTNLEIARETGLNRNTINALYHNKVNGIRFNTLEKLCKTYGLTISDLLDFEPNEASQDNALPHRLYKQEANIIPFTGWWPFFFFDSFPPEYFERGLGHHYFYAIGELGMFYLKYDTMNTVAQSVFERYGTPTEYNKLWEEFLAGTRAIERMYDTLDQSSLQRFSKKELRDYLGRLGLAYEQFWGHSLFIDAFDAGYDSRCIRAIAHANELSSSEIAILTTPTELTFNNERVLRLLEIVKEYTAEFGNAKDNDTISTFVQSSQSIKDYKKDFDWYLSSYSNVNHITDESLVSALHYYVSDAHYFTGEYNRLFFQEKERKKQIAQIMKRRNLSQNPLWFFQRLIAWREYRKKVNLMGIHVLFAILESLEIRTGIPVRFLKYLLPDEVDSVLKGLITKEMLAERYHSGFYLQIQGADYHAFVGKEAESLHLESEGRLFRPEASGEKVVSLSGEAASQGYARGVATVVRQQSDFDSFGEGRILVASMSRSEYLPILKQAIAIVTDEGGITSHAAIVARELSKPCIVGTKVATQVIHTGDIIEVRANHGTVRILECLHANEKI